MITVSVLTMILKTEGIFLFNTFKKLQLLLCIYYLCILRYFFHWSLYKKKSRLSSMCSIVKSIYSSFTTVVFAIFRPNNIDLIILLFCLSFSLVASKKNDKDLKKKFQAVSDNGFSLWYPGLNRKWTGSWSFIRLDEDFRYVDINFRFTSGWISNSLEFSKLGHLWCYFQQILAISKDRAWNVSLLSL